MANLTAACPGLTHCIHWAQWLAAVKKTLYFCGFQEFHDFPFFHFGLKTA
jgi:hypothetical protein